jgi:hypothetical protein
MSDLFRENQPLDLKISRVAVVPQDNRHCWIILNLSAEVADPKFADSRKAPRSKRAVNPEPGKLTKSTRCTLPLHPSANETTVQAEDQSGVEALGPALPSILKFMLDTDCTWEIDWQKINLSDSFWLMIISTGAEHNFASRCQPAHKTKTCSMWSHCPYRWGGKTAQPIFA